MIISFLVFVFALFLVLGAYLLATHGSDAKRVRLQKRLQEFLPTWRFLLSWLRGKCAAAHPAWQA